MNISQNTVFLQDVLRQVKKGMLLPAAFQRPYVWTRADVVALIESILRGYPVGSFLVWTPPGSMPTATVGRSRLGPVLGNADMARISLLLDGQNRLATIAWLAHDMAKGIPDDLSQQEKATWGGSDRLFADLASKSIRYEDPTVAEAGFYLPSAAIFDNHIANHIIRAKWAGDWGALPESTVEEGLKWFDRCTAAFREARVVVTEMTNATAAEAKDAFVHICKVGVPMSEADFNSAIRWAADMPN